ncbi:hypothetical protein FRC17_005578 [Serendipita sp. 399]|nr:hypothetical protein FRC17_005578 [Serendipita sp. 399]
MAYRYDRGVPLVDHRPSGVMKDLPVVPVAWQLTQYCVHNPDKPDEIGEERFIFTGHSSGPKKNNSLQGFYMRLEDLKRRVETNNESVAWSDVDELKKNRPLYPLWDPKGKLVHPDVFKQAFKTLEPKGSKSDDKVFQAKSLFLSHCQIARQARINAGLYDVLARFWDRLWEPNFYLYIDPKYQKDIREYAAKSATVAEHNAFPNSPNIDKEDIPVYILLNRIKEERQLKPKFTIVWRKDPLVDYLDKWGTHPNQLYTVYLDNEEMEKVEKNTTIGVWLPERSWPGKDNLLAADGVMKPNIPAYKSVKDAASTSTEVTKRSISIVKAFRRKPDQSTAMGRTSPNDLVRKWWGLAKDEKAAEVGRRCDSTCLRLPADASIS